MTLELKVDGMMCGGCEGSVTNVVEKISGVTSVKASHSEKKVTVEGDGVDAEAVKEAIVKAGFKIM